MSKLICDSVQINHEILNKLDRDLTNLKLFKIKLSNYYHLASTLINYLSEHEFNRANKYHFKLDSHNFIIRRVLLKFILSHLINKPISEICIKIDQRGKPYLDNEQFVYFNSSHSKDIALVVVSKDAVGIDVEYLNKDFDYSDILNHSFIKQEIDHITKSSNKVLTFFTFWTRKEAIVKATGKGINDELSELTVLDGIHTVNSGLVDNLKRINTLSFQIEDFYVASLACTSNTIDIQDLKIYDIPRTINELY